MLFLLLHSSHAITSDLSVSEVARAAEFFGSDGTIVTGTETGSPVEKRDLEGMFFVKFIQCKKKLLRFVSPCFVF